MWILDECHKLSNDAMNALLKTLEEPPDHVYFALCTTEPEKLLKTIKTRCTTFQVEELKEADLTNLVSEVAGEEDKDIPQEVAEQIAESAAGSARAALVILDQVIDLPKDEMEVAAKILADEQKQVIDLCRALMTKDNWSKVRDILKILVDTEPESVRRMVLGYCNSVLINGSEKAYPVMDAFREPFFNTGKAGLTLACYEAFHA